MSTFLGLLNAGRPAPRVIVLQGLGAAGKASPAARKAASKKATAKAKAKKPRRAGAPAKAKKTTKKASPAKKAAPAETRVVKVKGGLRNAPIDASHYPFKRSDKRPGADLELPKHRKRADGQTGRWECSKKADYVQVCKPLFGKTKKRDGTPIIKTVRIKKGYKKAYNAAYRKHLKKLGKPKFPNKVWEPYKETRWGKAGKPAAKRKSRAKKKA